MPAPTFSGVSEITYGGATGWTLQTAGFSSLTGFGVEVIAAVEQPNAEVLADIPSYAVVSAADADGFTVVDTTAISAEVSADTTSAIGRGC